MTRDPFDRLRDANPVPEDALPPPAMIVADHIVHQRALRSPGGWPAWAISASVALLVLFIGGGWLLWMRGDNRSPVASGLPQTSAPADVTTTGAPPPVVEAPQEIPVYLLLDADSTHYLPGPYLVPVSRSTAVLSRSVVDPVLAAVEFLLAGPTPGESEAIPAASTAIPAGTRVLGLEVSGRVATVDLSAEFTSGGGTLSMRGRLAQVVFTLTRFDHIDGVRFLVEGVPTTVFGGEGVMVGDPATRDEFDDLLPLVMIETPTYWGTAAGSPLLVEGTANVLEATVSLVLVDGDGLIIWEGFTTATCGTGCRGDFSIEIPYRVDGDQWGAVIGWQESMEDGSQMNVREHPVWLTATGEGAESSTATTMASYGGDNCSGSFASTALVEQPELPPAVAEQRAAVWDAAVECDWQQLTRIADSNTQFTFGSELGPEAAAVWWRDLEGRGERPMLHLAELLNLPYRTASAQDGTTYYVWPRAHGVDWDDLSAEDRQALLGLGLYFEDDLAGFEANGAYLGYRIGIHQSGVWMFFLAGD